MRKSQIRGALVVALLVAGCGVGAELGTTTGTLGAPGLTAQEQAFLRSAETTKTYSLMATSATKASATVAVSSTRNATWFGAAHLTDGKLNTAWGPAATDKAPSITMNLATCMDLSALSIKHSGGVTMNVEVMKEGVWTTVATAVTTKATVMDTVAVAAMGATAVRLTFSGDTAKLLVCEVECWGKPCAVPTAPPSVMPSVTPTVTPTVVPSVVPTVVPTVVPSVVPTVTPTATPTPEPTATPTPAVCCKAITGNGNIEAETEAGVFKFEINTPSGRVNFRGPDRGQSFLPILSAICTDTGAIVTADANNDGVADTTFTLVGEVQGNHLKTTSVTIDGDLSLFPDFLTPVTDIQGSLNIFDDPDCNGTPNGNVD